MEGGGRHFSFHGVFLCRIVPNHKFSAGDQEIKRIWTRKLVSGQLFFISFGEITKKRCP
jgi:hypothetical protein